jgi:hypothetical protein
MNIATKLSAYGVALVLVAGSAWAIGTAVGPFAGPAGAHDAEDVGHGDSHSGTVAEAEQDQPGGLASSRGGYTLLGVDLAVPGDFRPVGHEPSRVANVDGAEFTVATAGNQQGPAQEGATR